MKIFIIEDDGILRTGLTELIGSAGYETLSALSYQDALMRLSAETGVDLYLVDIMLGDGSGLDLVRKIRAEGETPVIILTALDGEDTVIEGLSCGADDYVTKPFRAGELLARIEANLRRHPARETIVSGHIEFRPGDGRLFVSDAEKLLRRSEMQLLELFLRSGGRLLKREYIFDSLWAHDAESVDENTLSVLVSRLRRELGEYMGRECIETVRGVGYRWTLPISTKNQGGQQ